MYTIRQKLEILLKAMGYDLFCKIVFISFARDYFSLLIFLLSLPPIPSSF